MSIFNTRNQETVVCINCGFETRDDIEYCPNCSTSYEPTALVSGRDLFLWGIGLLALSLVPLFFVVQYCFSGGFAAFYNNRAYHLIFYGFWVLFVKGFLWTTFGNKIQKTNEYSYSKNNVLLVAEFAAYILPIVIYLSFILPKELQSR
jgi:hypothetical protein